MVDAAKLKKQYQLAVVMCLALTTIPLLLGFVLFVMSTSPDTTPTEPIDSVIAVVFGILALSPLVTVPLIRYLARQSIASPRQPASGVESNIMVWALTEYSLWEVASLLGFVGVVIGAPIAFFLVFALVTYGGYAYSFPRWSRWTALVVELGLAQDPNSFALV